jgi:uncharacterized protein
VIWVAKSKIQNPVTDRIRPTLTQIAIYPIKSLDGLVVERAQISTGGALEFDRRWAIVDESGKIVNAKRTAKIQQVRASYEFTRSANGTLQLLLTLAAADIPSQTFNLSTQLTDSAKWLSTFVGFPVSLSENSQTGFPDDPDAYGPTIVSTATLAAVATWFPDLDLAEVRRRFRTNLEIGDVPAFWEDRLFAGVGDVVEFQLGDVRFYGINPCQRCVVPTRNSLTGEILIKFQQIFTQQRSGTLPIEANRSRFNHFYRLGINTQIPLIEAGKFLNTGDLLVASEP